MEEVRRIKKFYELKNVYRDSIVCDRYESSAEHSWSCLILIDYFLAKLDLDIDRLRVYELLTYHDIVEVYTGDVSLNDVEGRKNKKEREVIALNKLKEELPQGLGNKLYELFNEFEEKETLEARFAQAIDKLDPLIQDLDNKKNWSGWSEEFIREKTEKLYNDFPVMKEMFDEILNYLRENGYFNQD